MIATTNPRPAGWTWLILLGIFLGANVYLVTGRAYVPYDSTDQFFPQTLFVVRSLLRGDAPWWNPLVFAGIPVLGDPQSMIFTPHTLIGVLAGRGFGQMVFDLTTLSCLLIGAGALLIYGRRIGGTQAAGLLGAVLFMLGGVASSRLQHVVQILSYATIPVVLLAIQHLCVRPGALRVLLVAMAGLAMVLNPNQVVFLSIFALAPLALLHIWQSPRPLAALSFCAAAAFVVLLLSLPLFAAINETIGLSTRNAMSIDASAVSSFPAFNLLSLFLPGLYGALGQATANWTPTDLTQDYLYIGILPGLALLWAMLNFGRNAAPSQLAIVLIPVFILYSLGVHTPIYAWLVVHLPGVSSFRRPADAAFLLNFLCALTLVGLDFSGLRRRPPIIGLLLLIAVLAVIWWLAPSLRDYAIARGQLADLAHVVGSFARRAAVSAVLLLAAVILTTRLPRTGILCVIVLVAWTTFDLSSAGRMTVFTQRINTLADAAAYRSPDMVRTRDDPLAHLVAALDGTDPYRGGSWRLEAIGGAMGGNFPLLFGLANSQGYNPVQIATYAQAFGAQNLQQEFKRFTQVAPGYDSTPYRWLGLRYVLLAQFIIDHSAEFGEFGRGLVDLRVKLARDGSTRMAADGRAYEVWVLTGAFPKATLTELDALDLTAQPAAEGRCSVSSYRNTRVSVDCDTPRPARLVLNDTQASGWRACVNATPAPLTTFGGVLRSVAVPAGRSVTEFMYEPVPFWRGTSCNPLRQG